VPVLIIAENAKVAGITIPDRFENTVLEIMTFRGKYKRHTPRFLFCLSNASYP